MKILTQVEANNVHMFKMLKLKKVVHLQAVITYTQSAGGSSVITRNGCYL